MEKDVGIAEVILPETTLLDLSGVQTKDELFRIMVQAFRRAGKITSEDEFLAAVYEREAMGSTHMGNLIAIPHGKSAAAVAPAVAFCRLTEGVLYDTEPEPEYARLVFMLAVPADTAPDDYIRVLARLARLLIHEEFVAQLYEATSYADVVAAIQACEQSLITGS